MKPSLGRSVGWLMAGFWVCYMLIAWNGGPFIEKMAMDLITQPTATPLPSPTPLPTGTPVPALQYIVVGNEPVDPFTLAVPIFILLGIPVIALLTKGRKRGIPKETVQGR